MRKAIGLLLVGAGTLGLSAAGINYLQGYLARAEARAAWEVVEARSAVRTLVAGLDGNLDAGVPLAPGAPVARLVIPRIGLDEVVVEGVGDRELNAGPGHLPGSPLPGVAGNSVISAHRDRHFRDLGDVSVGDTIETLTRHKSAKWVVTDRKVVGRRAPVLRSTQDATLTLTTCWPLRYFGTAPDRLILTAKPVGGEVLATR